MRSCCLLFLAACGADELVPDPAAPDAEVGPTLRAEASATVTVANERVDCDFVLDLLDVVEDGDGFTAVASGEVFRRSFRDDALVFEFSALVAGPVTVTDGEARLVGDQPDDAAPFWLALEAIPGERTGTLAFEGTWTCAPILPGDPAEDHELDAPGTWMIGPT